MDVFLTKPWLKALSGLSINISAAWFIAPVIGSNISFPESFSVLRILVFDIVLGIIFLLITVLIEKGIEK